MTEKKRKWVNGQTISWFLTLDGRRYFTEDKDGGRGPATSLEVALWRKLYGAPPEEK